MHNKKGDDGYRMDFFFNLELENDQGGLYLLECATSVSQNSLYPFLSKPSQG